MQALMAILAGALIGTGVYMMLRRSIVKLVIGLALLSHGANLVVLTAGGVARASPPIIPPEQIAISGDVADPVPQALLLTAVVIGFGLQVFAMVLAASVHRATGDDDTDQYRTTDQ
jgi:multicomponent Na+:H+ antiporter subunit C